MTKESFFKDVFDVVRLVPKGRVTSYGAIAAYLGRKSGSRLVGWAMNQAEKGVPAHRVVNSQGALSGKNFFGGDRMQQLLEKEGVKVKNDKIQNFKEVFWDPSVELTIDN